MQNILRFLKSKTFYVSGNHEYYYGNALEWFDLFQQYGFEVLNNRFAYAVFPDDKALFILLSQKAKSNANVEQCIGMQVLFFHVLSCLPVFLFSNDSF